MYSGLTYGLKEARGTHDWVEHIWHNWAPPNLLLVIFDHDVILNSWICCVLVQKNSAVAGAVTGAAMALTSDNHSHEQVVQCAVTGAAISTLANVLNGIFWASTPMMGFDLLWVFHYMNKCSCTFFYLESSSEFWSIAFSSKQDGACKIEFLVGRTSSHFIKYCRNEHIEKLTG